MLKREDFLINNLSYSQLRTFISNPGEWQNQRLLGIYDNKMGVAGTVGTILHTFVENYLKSGVIENAIDTAYKTLYDGEDGYTYVISEEVVGQSLEEIKQHWKTKVVDFGKTGSNDKILKQVKSGIEAFLSEQIDYGELLHCELKMEYDVSEKLGKDIMVHSPIPFTCIADEVCRTTSPRTIMVDGKPETLEPGAIFIEDTKFKGKHSEMSEEDPKYIFQAFFNYYCARAHFGEAPKFITFREIKTSANRDNTSQHQTITIPFFGDAFEEYKVYFWRYIIETFERIKILQERDFVFNIFDVYNGSKEWEKQKAYYLGVEVGQLKSKIAQTSKNKHGSNVPVMGDRDPLLKIGKQAKNITEDDLYSIENKIRTAFRNFGVIVTFEKKINGYSFDQYLFSTARGVTMGKVKMHLPEIIQALEIETGLRIEAPVRGTKFIGVEIPREKRKFAELKKVPKRKRPLFPIGVDVSGKKVEIDLSDAGSPHVIVAGKTGSGKSECLKAAVHALKDKGDIILLDPKKVGLLKVKKHAQRYLTTAEEINYFFDALCMEMDVTYSQLEELEAENITDGKAKGKFTRKFIICDEFADLAHAKVQQVVQDKNDNDKVEIINIGDQILEKVQRLTQLGRAAGIHLIIATQRPSIKVIPGDIKANISTRVCFALATEVDSKVVLDEAGAEQLLGKGDMLFKNEGQLQRLQGFYI